MDKPRPELLSHLTRFIGQSQSRASADPEVRDRVLRVERVVGLPPGPPGAAAQFLSDLNDLPDRCEVHPALPSANVTFDFTGAEQDEIARDEAAVASGPPDGDDRDREAWNGQVGRARARELNPDLLAWYEPYTALSPAQAAEEALHLLSLGSAPREARGWGIKITSGGIESEAWAFVDRGVDRGIAMTLAAAFLLGHEFGHYIVDSALAQASSNHSSQGEPDWAFYSTKHREQHAFCRVEEAWCEAFALRQVELAARALGRPDADEIVVAVRAYVADGLPGYRDGVDVIDVFESLREVLLHAGVASVLADEAALLADLECRVWGANSVEVALVVTEGSAYAENEWR